MDRPVSATCPKCQTVLRIPLEWAGKAVKCKKCGTVVRAKGPTPATLPMPAAPVAQPATSQPVVAPQSAAPPQPVAMVYDPATNSYIPAPTGYPYPMSPGYPAPGPAPGYPYPPQGYAIPPGYPHPAPPSYSAPTGTGAEFDSMGERRTGRRKKYKKGGGGKTIVLSFIGLLALVVIGGVAYLLLGDAQIRERLIALLGGSTTTTTTPSTGGGATTTTTVAKTGAPPRRMLAMSVTKYLYCNPLIGGKNKNGVSEFNEAVKALAFRWEVPDSKENNQLFLLTDADGKLMQSAASRPMLKPIVMDTYTQFLATSRGQDRVVIYFGGHAMAKEGKGYLIPTEGDPNEPDTLIPLEDFWAKVKSCPAQQKVVLFDVCRLSTDDNAIRPGSEPMTEELEKLLHTPPDGVQVVTSCSASQTTGEFRFAPDGDTPQGSAFLGALRLASRKSKGGKVNPTDPLPVAEWIESASKRLNDVLGKDHPCVPKVSGAEGTAVAVNQDEPTAKRFEFPPSPHGADAKDVKTAFTLLDAPPLLGPPPADAEPLDSVVVFSADAMKVFKTTSPEEEAKDEAKYPWRKAALKAMDDLRGKWREFAQPQRDSVLKDGLSGKANDELKKAIEREQKPLSVLSLELSEIVDTLEEMKEKAEKDESKFWVATFRFALAQAKLRLAFSHEANLALGNVRTDNLPDGVERGVRLVQVPKMKARAHAGGAKEAQAILDELAKECKGTPWEVAAKQWRGVSLGLEWRVKKTDADTTTDEKK